MNNNNSCLILEDNPARYPYLVNLMFELTFPFLHKLVITTTAKSAVEELSREKKWNVIMLDHDLDGQVYVNPENLNTGYQVAKYIKEFKVEFQLCILHSLNEYAVPRMQDVLKGCGKVIYKPCVDL